MVNEEWRMNHHYYHEHPFITKSHRYRQKTTPKKETDKKPRSLDPHLNNLHIWLFLFLKTNKTITFSLYKLTFLQPLFLCIVWRTRHVHKRVSFDSQQNPCPLVPESALSAMPSSWLFSLFGYWVFLGIYVF